LYVPAVRPPVLTDRVLSPAPVPLAGLNVSQAASSDAVHVRVPPPVFEMPSVWFAGFAAPCCPENVNDVADSPIAGGTVTVRVTLAVVGLLDAPAAVSVIAPLYVPALRPLVFTDSVIAPAPVPLAGVSVSHPASSEAFQLSVPPPVFEMLSV
jgi:hypothetical protein